jgi:rfaE bifunctional protein kinase chain/domain
MIKSTQSQYSNKIVTVSKLKKIIGNRPREKKIVLCHGNFDVVHPGHIRHLIYAKTKADILIVSITADVYIQKGIYRPFIPEHLRALNLTVFQMVDYVIIDYNRKPLKNLSILKPDFYAKGFEYSSGHLPTIIKDEAKVVESYGGTIIFTPGDVVYSSTELLNLSQPKIENYKLTSLMERHKVTFKLIKDTLKKMKNIKVHVIGDIIVDSYFRTNLIGGNRKTPTPSVLYQEKNDYIGGAGIVAQHLRSAGAKVYFTTVLGDDDLKSFILNQMKKMKISINAIIDGTRPTTNKSTIISNGYKLLDIYKVDNQPISEKILKKIINFISKKKCDAIIFSDFRHGIFNKNSIPDLTSSVNKGVFKAADSQVAARWGSINDFKKFDLITPNEREARFALADQDSSISVLTRKLVKQTKHKNLILKLGERGAIAQPNLSSKLLSFTIPSFVTKLIDSTGAGDALLPYATLAMIVSKSLLVSSIIGSLAAACECESDGNIAIKPEQLIKKINSIEDSLNYKSQKIH